MRIFQSIVFQNVVNSLSCTISYLSLQTILYGAEASTLFPGQVWGGMSADIAIFTQAALDLPALLQQWDPSARSQWRIFSKLGKRRALINKKIVNGGLKGCVYSDNLDGAYKMLRLNCMLRGWDRAKSRRDRIQRIRMCPQV